jgi:hypothetical protein
MEGTPWWENPEEIEKLAHSGLALDAIEAIVKEAARQHELQGVYADYDAAGRIMARGYYDELRKLAAADAAQLESNGQEAKLAALRAFIKGA